MCGVLSQKDTDILGHSRPHDYTRSSPRESGVKGGAPWAFNVYTQYTGRVTGHSRSGDPDYVA